jgi:hypothetical protein
MILPLILALASSTPAATADDAWQIVRSAQRAVETATAKTFERDWRLILAKDPADRRGLLAIATLERLRYHYEGADSLYERILNGERAPSQYTPSRCSPARGSKPRRSAITEPSHRH